MGNDGLDLIAIGRILTINLKFDDGLNEYNQSTFYTHEPIYWSATKKSTLSPMSTTRKLKKLEKMCLKIVMLIFRWMLTFKSTIKVPMHPRAKKKCY